VYSIASGRVVCELEMLGTSIQKGERDAAQHYADPTIVPPCSCLVRREACLVLSNEPSGRTQY